jgi:hypothetical protein
MLVRIHHPIKSDDSNNVSVIDLSSPDTEVMKLVSKILDTENELYDLQEKIDECASAEERTALEANLKKIKVTKELIIYGFDNNVDKIRLVYGLIALSLYIDTLTLGRQKPGTVENDYFNAAGPEEKHFDALSSALAGNMSIRTLKLRSAPDIGLLEKIALVFVEQAKMEERPRLRSLKLRTDFVRDTESKVSKFYLFAQTLASNKNFLEHLQLSGHRINDKDMEILTGLGCSPTSLCAIEIRRSSITDQGALMLHDLSFLTAISINLEGNEISPKIHDQIKKDCVIKKLNDTDWEELKKPEIYFSRLPEELRLLTRTCYSSAIRQVTSFFKSPYLPAPQVAQGEEQILDLNMFPG